MTIDAKKLQTRLGVAADGIVGRGTLSALFRHFGCAPEGKHDHELIALVELADALGACLANHADDLGNGLFQRDFGSLSIRQGHLQCLWSALVRIAAERGLFVFQ